jgi:arginine/lysine/ornithine decarboxylase
MARNCHKSVYHAAFLNGMETLYLYPELLEEYGISDGIRKEQLKELLLEIADQKGIKKEELRKVVAAVVITSPTYDGICSDVKGITETAHACGIPVIVDQAHGAHFGFHPGFPENAVTLGADIVIHSVHKTLPAPTQTALLHCNGTIVNRELVRKFLGIYQTSSPSYVLMAGIELCMDILEREGRDRLEGLLRLRSRLIEKTGELKHIKIYPSMAEEGTEYNGKDGEFVSGRQEPGRLLCSVRGSNITGREFYHLLREKYHLQMEMYAGDYVIGILSMMDKEEGFERLAQALCETDRLLERNEKLSLHYQQRKPERACLLSDAFTAESEYIPLEEAAKRTAAEFVNLYPPGIPILVPGEKADKEILELIENYLRLGYSLQGIMGKAEDKGYFIRVLKQ